MELFENRPRSRKKQSKHREASYNFLNESSWDWVDYFRAVVNNWYSEFPDDKSFYKQFTSSDDAQHASAFFELYMFTLCRKLGYNVKYHEPVGSRKMDLTLEKEATKILSDCVLSGTPNLDQSIELIEKEIQDIIEDIDSPFYWISIHFLKTSNQTPKLSQIKRTIENELLSIDLEVGERKILNWSEGNWEIEFVLFKKSPPTKRSLASVIPSRGGGNINGPSMRTLRRTLNSKRGRSYDVDCPYIIAINTSNIALNDELIKGTLFGDMQISGFSNNLHLTNSFFYRGKPQNTLVSGVLIVNGLYSSNVGAVNISLWKNPWARHPISNELDGLTQYIPKLNNLGLIEKIEMELGQRACDLLEIKENYLN